MCSRRRILQSAHHPLIKVNTPGTPEGVGLSHSPSVNMQTMWPGDRCRAGRGTVVEGQAQLSVTLGWGERRGRERKMRGGGEKQTARRKDRNSEEERDAHSLLISDPPRRGQCLIFKASGCEVKWHDCFSIFHQTAYQ